MTSNASVQFHMRFVSEKHKELITSINRLVNELVDEDLNKKIDFATASLQKSNDLKASISAADCPQWLGKLIEYLGYFINKQWKAQNLVNALIPILDDIRHHQWVFENPEEKAFNFDSIFDHYKSESRLSELFDEIVRILEEIKESGEVDSVAMMTSLGKVIATLKQNKDGSYLSLNSAWSFLISFLQNYMWSELSKIPMLGTAMEALEKTINEANNEMFKVHTNVQKEMKETVENELKGLEKKTNFNFIGYDKSGAILPSSANIPSITKEA
ncbi:hypothetical protein [uncultured Desulfuromusa sp.]|uniref:hypothetical protein n=1 Tax=uncultured Desulfuromusa sp. TaxID=219183 RepID=UPI002AA8EFAF|nr:hypothetical protein [uncultured Desulfuromusa sp.]